MMIQRTFLNRVVLASLGVVAAYLAPPAARASTEFRHPAAHFSFSMPGNVTPQVFLERSVADVITSLEIGFEYGSITYSASQQRRSGFLGSNSEDLFVAFEASVSKTFGIAGKMISKTVNGSPAAEVVHASEGLYARTLLVATGRHFYRFTITTNTRADDEAAQFFASIRILE